MSETGREAILRLVEAAPVVSGPGAMSREQGGRLAVGASAKTFESDAPRNKPGYASEGTSKSGRLERNTADARPNVHLQTDPIEGIADATFAADSVVERAPEFSDEAIALRFADRHREDLRY